MRTFIELLPYRIEQALGWRILRSARTKLSRKLSTPAHRSSTDKRRLFVDLAIISNNDAGTGIQRVVRALALALLEETPEEWEIRFVSARRAKRYFQIAWPDRSVHLDPEEMRAQPGDVFLGLDYSLNAVRRHRRQLARFRRDGGTLWFLVHDLLPLDHPEWFSRNTVIRYKAWLNVLARVADGFLCNSPQTEVELKDALTRIHGITDYRTQVLPMGHAIAEARKNGETSAFTSPPPPRFDTSTPFTLMVGTLEPRKGHDDVIAAFDRLWRQGLPDRLVLVGRLGWQVDALRELILRHREYGTRLLWFDDVEDEELVRIYEACTGVIIAAHGEGFGLPLIEALGCGKPVLARNLPVFRMHDGKGVHFFPVDAPTSELAILTGQWLEAAHNGRIAVVRPTSNWRDAAIMLLAAIADPDGNTHEGA